MFCYQCVPRVWKRPPICKRCGSDTDYFTSGLCRRCHRSGPWIESCRECLAWGVTRHEKWLCQGCRRWRRCYETSANCGSCRRLVTVNEDGYCRLCWRQASSLRVPHCRIDVIEANRNGQQLVFADQFRVRTWPAETAEASKELRPTWPAGYPVSHRQLALFDAPRILTPGSHNEMLAPPVPELAAALEHAVEEHAAEYGWAKSLRISTQRGIRVLLALQDTHGARIRASELAVLSQLPNTTTQPVLDVLSATGILEDDRDPPLEAWFRKRTACLPEPMRSEVTEWFHALRDGSTSTPRTRPRSLSTVQIRVTSVVGALESWSTAGHSSLREITRDELMEVLPADDRRRHVLGSLRSLFRFLKARKLVFLNPTAHMRSEQPQPNHPLPMDVQDLRDAVNSTKPARAALAALVVFHGLRTGELRSLRLMDVRDGRLHLAGRSVVLAAPVRVRITGWLDERARRWPNTLNPHLFVNQFTAVRTMAVSQTWISKNNALPARAMREDRILQEALATQGDVRRLCDLFGITVGAAVRYVLPDDPVLSI